MISGFIGYPVIGYMLGKIKIRRKTVGYSIIAFLICVGITAFGTFYLTQEKGRFAERLYFYLSPNIIFLSISAFILLRTMGEKTSIVRNKKLVSILKQVSAASFGIYLIHAMCLFILRKGFLGIQFSAFQGNPIYAVPITAVLSFLLSFLAISTIKRVPYLNKTVP